MQRHAMIPGLRADKVEEYTALHAAVWPDVLRMISGCRIRNYSIYLHRMPDGQHCNTWSPMPEIFHHD